MNKQIIRSAKALATWLERLLALAILFGVIAFAFSCATALADMDWRSTETFYEMIYRMDERLVR
jgi:hypothetical protein